MKGVKNGRISSVVICTDSGWGAGTLLISSAWASPKRVLEIRLRDVVLTLENRSQRKERLKSFPKDVRRSSQSPDGT